MVGVKSRGKTLTILLSVHTKALRTRFHPENLLVSIHNVIIDCVYVEKCYSFFMKALTVSDPGTMVLAHQDEIRRFSETRYDHRLHAVHLVTQGETCPEAAAMLGDSTRTIQHWVNRFGTEGFSDLADADRPGRPPKLIEQQLDIINTALRKSPVDLGFNTTIWDGKTLSSYIEKQFGIFLGVRQCQRLFRQFGFRLRKPRPIIAKADQDTQAESKKNSEKF